MTDFPADMTLRDYFAGQALIGLIDRWSPSAHSCADEIAVFAYCMADAMLARRSPEATE